MARRRGKRPSRRPNKNHQAERQLLTIDQLAHRGDGVAKTETGPVYVPRTLPGEVVEADVIGERGTLVNIITASEKRVTAPCPHFEKCGGCSLQHLHLDTYLEWKQHQVEQALAHSDIEMTVDPIVALPQSSRRRATFAAERIQTKVQLGFRSARSHKIVEINECLILTPAIKAALPALKRLATLMTPRRGTLRLHVLDSETGLDIQLEDFGEWPDFSVERALIDEVIASSFARLSLGDEVLLETKAPSLKFGQSIVHPAPGSFVQATTHSERAMIALVIDALGNSQKVVDLFCGYGTFTLNIATQAHVHGVEEAEEALAALSKGARATTGIKPVTVEKRNLFHRPVMAKELNRFDAIVLDPPRAGAHEQIMEIAQCDVQRIVYVSCAPATFSRDAALLLEAGYKLQRITAVDQFLFSHHIELVGEFRK